MSSDFDIRRVVTGFDRDGCGTVVADESVRPVEVAALPGSQYFLLWGTPDGGATVGPIGDHAVHQPYFPGPGGTRYVIIRFPVESSVGRIMGDPTELRAEFDAKLAGMDAPFVYDDLAMHRTDSVDYGLCLQGELWMELDGGAEVHVTPGTCIVQRGTVHAWHNRGDGPALMLFVLVGADRGPR